MFRSAFGGGNPSSCLFTSVVKKVSLTLILSYQQSTTKPCPAPGVHRWEGGKGVLKCRDACGIVVCCVCLFSDLNGILLAKKIVMRLGNVCGLIGNLTLAPFLQVLKFDYYTTGKYLIGLTICLYTSLS